MNSGVGGNSLFFLEDGYSNNHFFNVSVRLNNLIAEQNSNRLSEEQSEKLEFILSLLQRGLGFREIAKVLNEQVIRTQRVCMGRNYVYAVLKRYKERFER